MKTKKPTIKETSQIIAKLPGQMLRGATSNKNYPGSAPEKKKK